nr:EOG090X0FQ8 [Lepidurus arcticus]
MDDTTTVLRDELISVAVKFLENPRVQGRARDEKEAFLRKKGLNDNEITEAFKLVATTPADTQKSVKKYSSVQYSRIGLPKTPRSRWVLVRDIGNTVLLLVGAAYGIHYVYQNYIAPFLFGRKKKSLESLLSELTSSTAQMVGELTTAVERLTACVSQLEQKLNFEFVAKSGERQELSQLKSEMASIKGILLGRKQFSALPALPLPAIPSWQVSKASSQTSKESSSVLKDEISSPLSSSPEILTVEEMQLESNKDHRPSQDRMAINDLSVFLSAGHPLTWKKFQEAKLLVTRAKLL